MSRVRSMPSVIVGSGRRFPYSRRLAARVIRYWLRSYGLTIALTAAFTLSLVGMALAGWLAHNEELTAQGEAATNLAVYLRSGVFVSAVFENWEGEFLQMAVYVMATAHLFQRGSAESRDPYNSDEAAILNEPLRRRVRPLVRFFYSYSLSIALAVLFVASFAFHVESSLRAANHAALLRGDAAVGLGQHLGDAHLWFESLQNWQSEFLASAVLVVLSIFLRYKGSPVSKPLNASNKETGG